MKMNEEEEDGPEGAPQDFGDSGDSGMEKGSIATPETELQMTMEEKQSPSSTFMVDMVGSPLNSFVPEEHAPAQRRGEHMENHKASSEMQSRRTSYKTKSGQTLQGSRRLSSLEMRRLPVDILLKPALNDITSVLSDEFHVEEKKEEAIGEKKDLLHVLCLRPGYSLKTQLMLSFGTISVITIAAVVVTCVIVAILAGQNVKNTSKAAFGSLATQTQGLTARYLAESMTEKILLVDIVRLLRAATQDRFAGYPSSSEEDVPFLDILSGVAKYPVDFPPPPLEWQFHSNVNASNYEENFQGLNYYRTRNVSTASGSFLFKGICDPSETSPSDLAYWPNCTAANNDITTGGVVEPTDTTELIYNKSKDLIPLLKALFESRDVIRDMGLFFSNSGAGASLSYPHYRIATQSTYVSTGCEWMASPNFYDPSKPIGTQKMIDRCSPKGEEVSSRIYSPLERSWCVDQALEPDRIHYSASPDAWDNGFWLLTMGQAIYDRVTNEFLACIYVGISLRVVDQELAKAEVVQGEIVSLIEWNQAGTVIGSSSKNRNFSEPISTYDMDLGMSKEDFARLYHLVDFESAWDPQEVQQKYSNYMVRHKKYFVSAFPMPPIPEKYDKTYRPLFLIVLSTPLKSVYGIVIEASNIVDGRVQDVNKFCIAAGAVGLIIALVIIVMMAYMLTNPLRKMNKIASDILSNFGDPTKDQAIGSSEDGTFSKEARCTPKTELSDVVKEFNKMVASFSGSQMVKTERHKHQEACNMFNLHKDFVDLYKKRGRHDFRFSVEPPTHVVWGDEDEEESMAYPHGGTNMMEGHDTFTTNPTKRDGGLNNRNFSSPLFIWIVALIVTPLLVVNVIITAVALKTVSKEFTNSAAQAEAFFLKVQQSKLAAHSRLRADFVSGLTRKATGDLHVLTRYAGWLLFGGVPPSDSYTDLTTGIEECKSYKKASQCPYVKKNFACACAWDDLISHEKCQVYPDGSRKLQNTYWVCQSQDSDERGDYYKSSYPATAYSPESTAWWDDQETVPGWENASRTEIGYETLFQRLRTASAVPLFETMYNYHAVKDSTIGNYLSFEADGLFLGYKGCLTALHVELVDFQSTVQNGAARLRPELCPLGKFGFDPR